MGAFGSTQTVSADFLDTILNAHGCVVFSKSWCPLVSSFELFVLLCFYLPFFLICSYCQRVVKLLNQINASFKLIELDKRGMPIVYIRIYVLWNVY